MSRKWFVLLICDLFLYQQPLMVSRFTLNLTTSSLGPPTTFSVISEVLFCVCSKRSSENSQFLLCSRFQTYVLPSLLVITWNSSSLGSIFSIVLRKEATLSTSLQSFSPDAVPGSQNKAKRQPTSLLSKHKNKK